MFGAVNTVVINVGRLLEVRIGAGYAGASEVADLFAEMARLIHRLPDSVRAVAVTDWRACRLMSSEAAEAIVTHLVRNNPHIERSAGLASTDSPSAHLQFSRVIRETGNPDRRLFTDARMLEQWLGEVLSADERRRLSAFLERSEEALHP
jgi:hypothetical protein